MSNGYTPVKNMEEFWREIRHSEDNPPCDIGLVCHNGRYVPGVRSIRDMKGGDEVTANFRNVPSEILDAFPGFAAIVAMRISAYEKEMKINPLVKANEELYHANKVSAENAAMEAKLAQKKLSVGCLVTKIETKTGKSVEADGDRIERLSNAVRILLKNVEANAASMGSQNPELATLAAQLEKLNKCNEALKNDLAELRKQQLAFRLQKKDNGGNKKPV